MTDDRGMSGDTWMVTVKAQRLSELEAIQYLPLDTDTRRQIRAIAEFDALLARPEDLQIEISETGLAPGDWKGTWGSSKHGEMGAAGLDGVAITADFIFHRVRANPEHEYVRVIAITDEDRRLLAEIADIDPDWIGEETAALFAAWASVVPSTVSNTMAVNNDQSPHSKPTTRVVEMPDWYWAEALKAW